MPSLLGLLPLLEGWTPLIISGNKTLTPGSTINIPLPNVGYIKYALIITTSENTEIDFMLFKASPQFLNDNGLVYDTRPAALLTKEPPYTILFAPTELIPYQKNTRISFYEPSTSTTPTQLTYIVTGIEIYDKEAFKKSLQDILACTNSTNTIQTQINIDKLAETIKETNKETIQHLKNILNTISYLAKFRIP